MKHRSGRARPKLLAATALLVGLQVCLAATGDRPTRLGGDTAASAAAAASRTRLPVGLAAAVSSAVGTDRRAFGVRRRHGVLVARGGSLEAVFDAGGPSLFVGVGGRLSLRLNGVGRPGSLVPPSAAVPDAKHNVVSYRRGSLSEWYRNGPLGLEQGFTLRRRPPGEGLLTLAVAASGSLRPRLLGGRVTFTGDGASAPLSYGGLSALDAAGRPLPARLELRHRTLLLRVDDARARYPLTVDPFVQQGSALSGGSTYFGYSVALSADGNTALVGDPTVNGNKGAAWVFTRSGQAWAQQGPKLLPNDETGNGQFGSSVSLSANGRTALIGGEADNGNQGAAWVFGPSAGAAVAKTRFVAPRPPLPVLSSWGQQGRKLVPNDEVGSGRFGHSVSLSADATLALIGGYGDNGFVGAAWVFVHSPSGGWIQERGKLTGAGEIGPSGNFGEQVALSADGATALVAANTDNDKKGATWAFSRETGWGQIGDKMTGGGEVGQAFFGWALALSADGRTALIGGMGDNGKIGAAWVFVRSGAGWSQQAKLTASDTHAGSSGAVQFGYSVSLSADGSTALIGGPSDSDAGAVWLFTRSGSAWGQQGGKLTAGAQSRDFGGSVSLAPDANAALIGGGAQAWVFVNAPTVATVGPATGPAAGGTTVTIKGSGFTGARAVSFGPAAAASFTVDSPTQISAVSPRGAGTVDVAVTTSAGSSGAVAADKFTYLAPATTTTTPTTTQTTTKPATTTTTTTTTPQTTTGSRNTSVRASLLAVKTLRTKGGARVVRVDLTVGERLVVTLTLRRGRASLARKRFAGIRPRRDVGLSLAVPRRVSKGAAALTIVLRDAAGNTLTLSRRVTLGKP